MKLAKSLTIATVFAFGLVAASAAKAECSNATLKGAYADQDTGTIVGAGPFAGVNVDTFDGKGHLTIKGWSSVNGAVSAGTETGTYKVNSNCTGTYKVEGAGFTVDAFFVIAEDGKELKIVITDTGNVINCIARKQFAD